MWNLHERAQLRKSPNNSAQYPPTTNTPENSATEHTKKSSFLALCQQRIKWKVSVNVHSEVSSFLISVIFLTFPPAIFMEVVQTYLSSDSLLQMEKRHYWPHSSFVRHWSCIVCTINISPSLFPQFAMGPEVVSYGKLKFVKKHFMKLNKWTCMYI